MSGDGREPERHAPGEHASDARQPPQAGSPLSVVALLVGDPGAAELWTLRRLADCGGTLHVVSGRSARNVPMARRLRRLVRDHGVVGVVSRLVAARTVGRREEHREADELDRLLDIDELRRWWARSGLEPLPVASLNDPEARAVIASLRPDLIVRVSGGILHRGTFSLARIGTLNIHHGLAGAIRGMWSIPWGIVESRRDWIGATVHVIDEGIDTGKVLWTGAPQVSAGDTGTTLYFRAHVEAVEHLARVVHAGGNGMDGPSLGVTAIAAPAVYRSAPGVVAWLRYLRAGRGARARVVYEASIR